MELVLTQQTLEEPVERVGGRSSQRGHYTDTPSAPGNPKAGWPGTVPPDTQHIIFISKAVATLTDARKPLGEARLT